MPLNLPGSVVLGPQSSGTAAPASLTAYLASIGKASWYGGYLAGVSMFSSSSGSGSAVTTDGATVGSWLPYLSAGGWTSLFGQGNSAKKPRFGTNRNGKPGLYGDADIRNCTLNSNTALNLNYTVLMSAWVTFASGARVFSHYTNSMEFVCPASSTASPVIYTSSTAYAASASSVIQTVPVNSTTSAYRVGWSSTGTGHYNSSPALFSASNNTSYSSSTIHELWFVPWLTPSEISMALTFLA